MAGSEVLSQSEIDALLSALSHGATTAEEIKEEQVQKKIKLYDFKRPDKFSKDQIRTLHMMHENFSRFLNTYLSAHLRTIIHIDVASVDQFTYEEFLRSLPNPSVLAIFQMVPLKGNAILEITPEIVFVIIDRLFGGPGIPHGKTRPLTDIEEVIIRRIMDKAMEALQEAWKQIVALETHVDVIETNPQFAQIVPPNDMVVIITLKIKIGPAEGFINLCIPYLVLEPIMTKLTTSSWVESALVRNPSPEDVAVLQQKLERAYVPVTVEMGKLMVSLKELLDISVGDVLTLETNVDSDFDFKVGTNVKFKCKPGLIGSRVAVQITGHVFEGDDKGG